MLQEKVDSLDSVDSKFHGMYSKGDDGYSLNEGAAFLVSEISDIKTKMGSAKDHEKQARKDAESKASDAAERLAKIEATMEAAAHEKMKQSGDKDSLITALEEKLEALKADNATALTSTKSEYEAVLRKSKVDSVAVSLAAKLGINGDPTALLPHIAPLLDMDVRRNDEGSLEFKTIVLEGGKPSALTLDELESKIRGNASLSPLIKGTSATGSGASGSKGGGTTQTTKSLSEMSHKEKTAEINRRVAEQS